MSYDDTYPDEGARIKTSIPKLEMHLNSPIRDSLRILFLDALKMYPSRKYDEKLSTEAISYVKLPSAAYYPAKSLIQQFSSKEKLLEKLNPSIYSILGELLSYSYNPPATTGWINDKSPYIHKILFNLITQYNPDLKSEFIEEDQVKFTQTEQHAYSLKVKMEDIRDQIIRLAERKTDEWRVFNTPFPVARHVLIHKSFVLFIKNYKGSDIKDGLISTTKATELLEKSDSLHLCTYEQFLCLLDTMIGRFFTMYEMRIMSDKFPYKIQVKDLVDIYRILDEGFAEHGNDLFNQIKMFEPIVFSQILLKADKLKMRKNFNDFLVKDIVSNDYYRLLDLNERLAKLNTAQLCEMFGAYRHWGHPIVDEPAGCKKIKKISDSAKPPDSDELKEVEGALVREFCINFIQQHSRWPACNIDNINNPILKDLIERNDRRMNLFELKVDLKDWCQVEVSNELPFDYVLDYTELLSDTSIAPILSENKNTYNSDCSGHPWNNKEPTTSRRLLTEILLRSKIDLKEICAIIKNRCVPLEWLIIKLSPKEREIKLEPRCFAMMVLEMRLYFCLLEHNIVKNVFPLFPQQSMTLNEEKLMKRLILMAKKTGNTAYIEMIMGIDFKSWNIHWNVMNTRPFAKMLDKWFGHDNLYTYGHEFFSTAEMSLSSNFYIPEKYMSDKPHRVQEQEHLCWTGHIGGLEGIMQKFWTLITIGILLVVEHRTGIPSSIVGQGDNQVCKLKIPLIEHVGLDEDANILMNEDHIEENINSFKTSLDKLTASIGLVLKPEETWVSHTVLIYGKVIFINGAMYSQSVKRSSRILADVNDDYPTLNNRIGTLQSSGYSTAPKTHLMALPWYISQLESILTLHRDIENIKNQREIDIRDRNFISNSLTPNFIHFWLLSNGEFTTIPTINLLDYTFRGHPDPFCTYITFLINLIRDQSYDQFKQSEISNSAVSILLWMLNEPDIYGPESSELLINNPTSINFKTPVPVTSTFKKEIVANLQTFSKNIDISELFAQDNIEYDKKLYKFLASTSPLYPRLLNVIAESSPTGTRNYFLSQFRDSKTVKDISLGGTQLGSEQMLVKNDATVLKHVTSVYKRTAEYRSKITEQIFLNIKSMCPTKLTHLIRVRSHKAAIGEKQIEGITMPHPAHILELRYDDPIDEGQYVSALSLRGFDFHKILEIGNQPAYVGSRTREKPSGKIITVSAKNRPFKSACRIRQMQTWAVEPDNNFDSFLTKLIATRTNVNVDLLSAMCGTIYIGSLVHRVSDVVTKHDTLNNVLHSFTTHFALSSDKLALTTRGGDDYNIQISGLFHYMLRMILIKAIAHQKSTINYVQGMRVNDCCHSAYLNLPTKSYEEYPETKILTENPLLYSKIETFQEIVVPETGMIKYSSDCSPADAIGTYLVSRLRGITSSAILSSQESTGPYASLVSMTEVIHVGIINIIKAFAKCLYLYIGDSYENVKNDVTSLGSDLWSGVGEICLMPKMLESLIDELELDGVVDAYNNKNNIIKKLNTLLYKELERIDKDTNKNKYYNNFKFFLMNNFKYANVLIMWNYKNICTQMYPIEIGIKIRTMILKHIRDKVSWKIMMREIIHYITSIEGYPDLYINLLNQSPILLMRYPPEYFFRKWDPIEQPEDIEEDTSKDFAYKNPLQSLIGIDYPIKPLEITTHSFDYIEMDISDFGHTEDPNQYAVKKRLDQAYRLDGTLSTAFYKLAEILAHERILLTSSCVCIADGEASMSLLCALTSQCPTYYNSLQPDHVETHRYEHFVPGSFQRHRDLIKCAKLALIYGGDLTNHDYLTKFISQLPVITPLLTCDAETSGNFALSIKMKIYNAILKILMSIEVQNIVVKDFLDNLKLLSAFASTLKRFFREVKIVIPHYSSRENLECFVVGKGRIPIASFPLSTTKLYPSSDYNRYLIPLTSFRREKQESPLPFLHSGAKVLFSKFQTLARTLGLHSNYSDSLNKLLNVSGIDHLKGVMLIDWLKRHIQVNHDFLIGECKVYINMCKGEVNTSKVDKNSSWLGGIAFSQGSRISQLLSRNTDVQISCEVLIAILSENDLSSAYLMYITAIKEERRLIYNNTEIYDYTVRDQLEWESKYLKHLWRIWGHNKNDN